MVKELALYTPSHHKFCCWEKYTGGYNIVICDDCLYGFSEQDWLDYNYYHDSLCGCERQNRLYGGDYCAECVSECTNTWKDLEYTRLVKIYSYFPAEHKKHIATFLEELF